MIASVHRERAPFLLIFGWIVAVFVIGAVLMPTDKGLESGSREPSRAQAAARLRARRDVHWRNVSFVAFLPPAGLMGLRMGRARGRRDRAA